MIIDRKWVTTFDTELSHPGCKAVDRESENIPSATSSAENSNLLSSAEKQAGEGADRPRSRGENDQAGSRTVLFLRCLSFLQSLQTGIRQAAAFVQVFAGGRKAGFFRL